MIELGLPDPGTPGQSARKSVGDMRACDHGTHEESGSILPLTPDEWRDAVMSTVETPADRAAECEPPMREQVSAGPQLEGSYTSRMPRENGTESGDSDPSSRYPVDSVVNASRVLLMFREVSQLTVGQVATELGVARSTAHRLLTTLQSQGLLHQAAARQAYRPGPALVELGASVVGASDLRHRVRPLLERLNAETGETTHLLVLLGTEVLFVDGVEGRHAIRAAPRIGARELAHTSAAGKVLLASLPLDELRYRYPKNRLVGGTANAVTSRAALESELDATREQGYGINRSESETDLCAISVALRDPGRGHALGAISVSGPASRMDHRVEEIANQLLEVSAAFSD